MSPRTRQEDDGTIRMPASAAALRIALVAHLKPDVSSQSGALRVGEVPGG